MYKYLVVNKVITHKGKNTIVIAHFLKSNKYELNSKF